MVAHFHYISFCGFPRRNSEKRSIPGTLGVIPTPAPGSCLGKGLRGEGGEREKEREKIRQNYARNNDHSFRQAATSGDRRRQYVTQFLIFKNRDNIRSEIPPSYVSSLNFRSHLFPVKIELYEAENPKPLYQRN